MLPTIVIPVYNGAKTIQELVERLIAILGPKDIEVVLVNDGSQDNSHEICFALQSQFPNQVTYICLSKNFGEHNAVMAGLNHARGDYVIIMDDDFQNPPEEVTQLIEIASKGEYDVVYTYYKKKQHHWFRNLGSNFNTFIADFLLEKPKGLYLSSFKCLSRFAVQEIIKYQGPYPYIDGLILRCTQRIGTVQVSHDLRIEGESGYTLRKLIRLWMNMFFNFSVLPLRISIMVGFLACLLAFLLIIIFLIEKIKFPQTPMGWTSLIFTILLFAGVQLISLGVMGEYLGRLFLSSNQTPQFIIREIYSEKIQNEKSR